MTIIYALIIFLFLIFIHEFGHFISAKACGVRVNEFSLGMGPTLFKKQKGETLYCFKAIPIGGYCAMEGEDEESEDDRAFNKKKSWQKILILVAGATMNLILCIVIMSGIALHSGAATTTLESVTDGGPAYTAGIEAGDKIVAIDGNDVNKWSDVNKYINEAGENPVTVEVERDGVIHQMTMNSVVSETGNRIIGVYCMMSHNPVYALKSGVVATWDMAVTMLEIIKELFTGDVSTDALSGPIGIVSVVNESVNMGFTYMLYLTALISLNLAVFNLLPFPALDGGRILFVIIRKFTSGVISDKVESTVHFIGIMCLFALMIYVTWNDIVRLFVR